MQARNRPKHFNQLKPEPGPARPEKPDLTYNSGSKSLSLRTSASRAFIAFKCGTTRNESGYICLHFVENKVE